MRTSWRWRLTLAYAGIFAATLLVGVVLVWLAARATIQGTIDASLQETAHLANLQAVQNSTASGEELRPTKDTTIEWLDERGQIKRRFGGTVPAVPFSQGYQKGGGRRSYTAALSVPGGGYVRVSRPLDASQDILDGITQILSLATVILILLSGLSGYWLAGRALQPVRQVARTAQRIAERNDFSERVPTQTGNDEMSELVGTVNTMLDRLESTLDQERTFARAAAHELRTPLTALNARVELALSKPREAQEYQRNLTLIQGNIQHLMALSERLLQLARTVSKEETSTELAALSLTVGEEMADQFRNRGQQLRFDVQETWVPASETDLRLILSNLLDNALKYGGSPGLVIVKVERLGLTVSNDGQGPDQSDWNRLLQPFERGQRQKVPGTGLGLALVAELCHSWRAMLTPQWGEGRFGIHIQWPHGSEEG